MKKHPDIEKKVEDALHSLDSLQPAEAPAHIYTRIRAGIMQPEESSWSWIASILSRPAVALAISCILIAVNAWIIFGNETDVPEEKNDQVAALAQEYNFDQPYPSEQNFQQP